MEQLIFSLSCSSVPYKGRLCTGDQRGSIKVSTFPSSEFSQAAGRWQQPGHGISRYIAAGLCLDTIPVYGCKMKPGGTFLFLSYGRIPKMPRLSQEWSPPIQQYTVYSYTAEWFRNPSCNIHNIAFIPLLLSYISALSYCCMYPLL